MALHQEVKKQAQRRDVATAETLYPILFQPRFGAKAYRPADKLQAIARQLDPLGCLSDSLSSLKGTLSLERPGRRPPASFSSTQMNRETPSPSASPTPRTTRRFRLDHLRCAKDTGF